MDNRHLAGNGGEIKGLVMPWHIYGGSEIGGGDGKSWGDLLPPMCAVIQRESRMCCELASSWDIIQRWGDEARGSFVPSSTDDNIYKLNKLCPL